LLLRHGKAQAEAYATITSPTTLTLAFKRGFQHIVNKLGVCAAPAQFHHLADKEPKKSGLSSEILPGLFGIG
jgi:hypothetical protein